MNRLDQHVRTVRQRLTLGTFLRAVAWSLLIFASVVLLNILIDRFLVYRLPRWEIWFWSGLGVSVAAAMAYSLYYAPTCRQAAIQIDERLNLKEGFSTALYMRGSADPFAAAAVGATERMAENVNLEKRFPIPFPMTMVATLLLALVTGLTAWQLGSHPLFGREAAIRRQMAVRVDKPLQDTRKLLDQAIAKIESTPETPANADKIAAARKEVAGWKQKLASDPAGARRSALRAMQDMEAIKQKIAEAQRFSEAKNEIAEFKSMPQPADPNSPIGKVQSSIGKGNFTQAVEDLKNVVDKFDQMDHKDQEKAAGDMDHLAKQLAAMAQDPAKQKKVAQQLQKMGADQEKLKQLADAVQQAANGDKQAQQQVQQLANQIAQNMNQQQGMTQQQQQQVSQQVQQMVKQMQGAANSQAAAQQMAQSAQAMANAMQQAAGGQKAQASSSGKAGAQQQNSTPQGASSQGAQAKNQGGQPGAGSTPAQAGQGGQQPGSGQQGQSMAGAQAQMQQNLQQLQQAADDAAQIAQQQGGDSGQADSGQNPDNGNNAGVAQQNQPGGQQWNPNPAQGAGGLRPKPIEAPVGFKKETAISQVDDKGKLLASSFVKAMSQKGASRLELTNTIQSAEQDSTDEVEQDRISRPAQNVVKRYFDDLKQDVDKGQ